MADDAIRDAEREEAANVAWLRAKRSMPSLEEQKPDLQEMARLLFMVGFSEGSAWRLSKQIDKQRLDAASHPG